MSVKAFVTLVAAVSIICSSGVEAQCLNGQTKTLYADTTLRTFSSPDYPDRYPSNSHCQWLLEAPSDDYLVRMDTVTMDLEAAPGCVYDSVTVYNGNRKQSSQLRRFCAGYFSAYSTGRHLLVIFKSDDNVQGQGFQFRYFAVAKIPPTTPSTTTEEPKKEKSWLNTGVLIGGVVGGVAFVIIVGLICGRCLGGGRVRQPPVHRPAAFYHSHAPPATPLHAPGDAPTISTAVHMVQNNNSVFMVSQALGRNVSPAAFASPVSGGVSNVAFDGSGEDPASGISVLSSAAATAAGFMAPPIGVPPPSYSESMLRTNPPALPPSPRHSPNVAPALVTDTSAGLAPPPLFAPRGPAPDVPVPSASTGVAAGDAPQQPGPSTPAEVSSCAPQAPQHPAETSSVRASASASQQPAPSTGSASGGPQRYGGGNYGFEFSSSDSISTPTDSTLLTSPSMILSDPGWPMRDVSPQEETASSSVENPGRQTESVASQPQRAASSGWPAEAPRLSCESQTSAGQSAEFVADFSKTENTNAQLATGDNKGQPGDNAERGTAFLAGSPAVVSQPEVVVDAEHGPVRVESDPMSQPEDVDAEHGPVRVESDPVSQPEVVDAEHGPLRAEPDPVSQPEVVDAEHGAVRAESDPVSQPVVDAEHGPVRAESDQVSQPEVVDAEHGPVREESEQTMSQVGFVGSGHHAAVEAAAQVSQPDDDHEASPPRHTAPEVYVHSTTPTSADGPDQSCSSGLAQSAPTEQEVVSRQTSLNTTSICGEALPEIVTPAAMSSEARPSAASGQADGSSDGVAQGTSDKAEVSGDNIPGPASNISASASNLSGPACTIPGPASDTPGPACENISIPAFSIPCPLSTVPGLALNLPGPTCDNVPGLACENIPIPASDIPSPAGNIPIPAPDFVPHQHAMRTASATSLPPPPSPHPSAGFDSDAENFPCPPSPLATDSDGDPQSPPHTDSPVPRDTASPVSPIAEPLAQLHLTVDPPTSSQGQFPSPSWFEPLCLPVADSPGCPGFDSLSLPVSSLSVIPHSPAPSRADSLASVDSDSPILMRAYTPFFPEPDSPVLSGGGSPEFPRPSFTTRPSEESLFRDALQQEGAGYLGGAAPGEEPYGGASLSSRSSPLVPEKELRNSTSFPDFNAAQDRVEAIRREAFQRADSQ